MKPRKLWNTRGYVLSLCIIMEILLTIALLHSYICMTAIPPTWMLESVSIVPPKLLMKRSGDPILL